jgi:hypothetical protein
MASVFLIFFTLVWSGFVLGFDGWTARDAWKQFESGHYPGVVGKVAASQVKSHPGSKRGRTYTAEITYVYTVGTQEFSGTRLRYDYPSSAGYADAFDLAGAHPVGAAVTVYYNPAQPDDAVLFPRLDRSFFMLPLFLTPFHMVMLGFWCGCAACLRGKWFRPVAGGVKLIADGMVTRVRLPQWAACWGGLGTAALLGFVSIFAVGIPTNMHPPLPLALAAIGLVYGAGLAVYLRQRSKINSGIDDLIIDGSSRTLQLPLTFDRQAPVTVNLADVQSVWIEKIVHCSRKGGVSYTYAPTLRLSGTEPALQKLADWSDHTKAGHFAQWLGKQIGVPVEDENSRQAARV